MTHADNRQAWAQFWTAKPEPSTAGGCLPHALQLIDRAQRHIWQSFAHELRKGARVLDLGTGDGAVLVKMGQARPDLKLIGVDSSPRLPPSPRGVTLKAGTALESLPFPAASFDAITSQFGYEYGDTEVGSVEVSRVLKPGARLCFLSHHRNGPILAHNLPRRNALRWALAPGGYLEKARALATARRTAPLPTPQAFRDAPAEGQRLFPGQSVAAEFLAAILQTLELGRTRPPGEVLDVLNTLGEKAGNEIARIESLSRAALDPSQVASLVEQLRAAGIAIEEKEEVYERPNRPFAWLIKGVKKPA